MSDIFYEDHSLDGNWEDAAGTMLDAMVEEGRLYNRPRGFRLTHKRGLFAIASARPVGMAIYWTVASERTINISYLYVFPEFRRLGVGANLIGNLSKQAADASGRISLHVSSHNFPMLQMLKAVGFREEIFVLSHRPDHPHDFDDLKGIGR